MQADSPVTPTLAFAKVYILRFSRGTTKSVCNFKSKFMRWAHMISHGSHLQQRASGIFIRSTEFDNPAQKPQQCCCVSPHQKLGSGIHGSAAERTQLLWKRGTSKCPFVVHHLYHLTPHIRHYGWRGVPKSKMSFPLICWPPPHQSSLETLIDTCYTHFTDSWGNPEAKCDDPNSPPQAMSPGTLISSNLEKDSFYNEPI